MIDLPDDFRDMLVALADAGTDFAVVGGYAGAFHGHVRATKEIDILVRGSAANAPRVYDALAAFGAPIAAFDITAADFASYDGVLQIGVPLVRIDILNRIAGVAFDEAVADGSAFEIDGRRIPVIGRDALIANKRAVARPQDLVDADALASGPT